MITAPTNWDALWNSGARIETRIKVYIINSSFITIGDSDLTSSGVTLQRAAYDYPSAGNAASEMLQFTMYNSDFADMIRVGHVVTFGFRLNDGSTATSWVERGKFYVSSVDKGNTTTSVVAYDEMSLLDDYTPSIAADITIGQYANVLYTQYGCTLLRDSPMLDGTISAASGYETINSVVARNYVLPFDEMDNITARDVVSGLAAALGGNAYIDNSGVLQCKSPFFNVTRSTVDATFSAASLSKGRDAVTYNAIVVKSPSNGDFMNIPGAQCEVRLTKPFAIDYLHGRRYALNVRPMVYGSSTATVDDRMFNATGAFVTPLVELFDMVRDTATSEKFALAEYRLTIAGNCTGQLSRPLLEGAVTSLVGKHWYSSSSGYVVYSWHPGVYGASTVNLRPVSAHTCLLRFTVLDLPRLPYGLVHVHGGQRITFHAEYYYQKESGSRVSNVDIVVVTTDRDYYLPENASYMVEAVYDNLEALDIDPDRPYSFSAKIVKNPSYSGDYEEFTYDRMSYN